MPIGQEATAPLSGSPNSSTAGSEIMIGDASFCTHGKEVCMECAQDFREENALTFGLDFMPERDPLPTFDYTLNKDGETVCSARKCSLVGPQGMILHTEKHRSTSCAHTNFKKAITAANKAARKK